MPGRIPQQLVVFRVGATTYGLDIDSVQEILAPLPVTPLAGASKGVLGLVDVRNRVVPVFDLHTRFGAPRPENESESRMVLVELSAGPVALLVSEVDEVTTVDPANYQAVSTPGDPTNLGYLCGVFRKDDRLVLWVDHLRLVPPAVARAGQPKATKVRAVA